MLSTNPEPTHPTNLRGLLQEGLAQVGVHPECSLNAAQYLLGFGGLGFGFRVLGFGFWVLGFGFWVLGFG